MKFDIGDFQKLTGLWGLCFNEKSTKVQFSNNICHDSICYFQVITTEIFINQMRKL